MAEKNQHEDTLQSQYQAERTTDKPLIRVMALHAMTYCERLFYLEEVESEVRAAVARAEELRSFPARPKVDVPEYLCRTCSLAPICLPEEERFSSGVGKKPQRLFPVDEDRRIIHLVEQGTSIRKDGDQLVVHLPDGDKKPLPGMMISALVLHGNVQISTQCIHFCAANNIGVHWLSYGGYYVGALSRGGGGVQRRVRQFQAFQDHLFREGLACRLVLAKVENQLRYLLRCTRENPGKQRHEKVLAGIERLRTIIRKVNNLRDQLNGIDGQTDVPETTVADSPSLIDIVRGYEGKAGEVYFSLLPGILKLGENDFLSFTGRNRRPPRDPFNALLSFGYALLYRDCMNSILAVGLDPSFGFMHTPRSAAYPLALDMMDIFRLILWDIPLIGSVNRNQWSKDDFSFTSRQVWLNENGRRKAIKIYENRKQDKWKHPVLQYSLSYARTIELETRLLEKEWAGQAGLFAALRLR